ncbi:MAG: ClbS/DfsB family four-helix bundle protein [Anaerolineaceae bacterium]|nr:ClbS/DfsB family four-helix bundle protein [Anaerolineaceae bacterium]
MNKAELLDKIQASWDEINEFLASLSTSQKTQPTDAAGWTVKDHVIHMAAWEDGLTAMLDKQMRREHMGIDEATWKNGDDAINAMMQQRYQNLTWDEVERKRHEVHNHVLKQIDGLSDESLQLPYHEYNPNSPSTRHLDSLIGGSTYYHYDEHLPWMAAIAAGRES